MCSNRYVENATSLRRLQKQATQVELYAIWKSKNEEFAKS